MRYHQAWVVALGALLAAAPAAAEPGVTDTEILIGGSNSFSGPLAFTGEQITKGGVELYLRVVNDAGGIHGRKVRTLWYDDAYRPLIFGTLLILSLLFMPGGVARAFRFLKGEQG